ncbi:hypothetical protein [Pareuzebyella sediminis]|uniref:hypothetical protein n=1 Tax=Pareuzebyella sediminis TaxID=2607998 RepID=UPI001E60B6DF|nr:hypothetical protein [Pareuzebyella sediminis]
MSGISAQIETGVYFAEADGQRHELKVIDNYFVHSIYSEAPPEFNKTMGGFYKLDGDILKADLEFNSAYENDGVTELTIPVLVENGTLIFDTDPRLVFEKAASNNQVLDGMWLFATRGPDEGQERRGDENPRKTLKFLKEGRFQWIAYNTDTMQFFGTGGGDYSAKSGVYTEDIEYFSRDNSRVGATLNFNYEMKGDDWHHTGKNSRGEPMYEIWSKR